MSDQPTDQPRAASANGLGDITNVGHAASCFLVGCFAGALASFFPRLMAILSGDPTKSIQLFSPQYLTVGAIVAAIVGVVVLIMDSRPERRIRDVFMTALGIPTLLMGAISTGATTRNIDSLQKELEQTATILRSQSGVGIQEGDEGVPKVGSVSLWRPWDLLLGTAANAADLTVVAQSAQSSLGISVVQDKYFVVYGRAATRDTLEPLQTKLRAAGIETQFTPGSRGETFLVPLTDPVKPYAQAVQSAVRAKDAGATPYLIRAPGN
jgi:hypothetical protein